MKQHITHLFLLVILCFTAQAQSTYVDVDGIVKYYKSGTARKAKMDSTSVIGLGKKQALQDQNISQRTPFHTLSTLRSHTGSLEATVNLFDFTQPGRAGLFQRDGSDTTTPDDGALTVVDASGNRWKRSVPDKRLTPQMFGAYGDNSHDDATALQAWLSTVAYEHFLPAATYICGTALTRTDLGSLNLVGAGSARTEIRFPNNTGGLSFTNTSNSGPLGACSIRGITFRSTGVKTAQTCLYIKTQEYQRPGPILEDISVKATGASNQQWGWGIWFDDCSGISVKTIDIQGFDWNVMTGIYLTNSVGRPCYEQKFLHVDIRAVYRGVNIQSAASGNFGIEGVQFTDLNIVGCNQGFLATSPQGSPFLAIRGAHINATKGGCINIDGYQQVMLESTTAYSNPHTDGVAATSAVYINNAITCEGMVSVYTSTSVVNAVELSGFVALTRLAIYHTLTAAGTNTLKVNSGAQYPTIDPARQWDGNTTFGSTQGKTILDLSDHVYIPVVTKWNSLTAAKTGDVVTYDAGVGRFNTVSPRVVQGKSLTVITVSSPSSVTIDPAQFSDVLIDNGANSLTLVMNQNTVGTMVWDMNFYRTETSSGAVSITQATPTFNPIQLANGVRTSAYSLPTTTGQRSAGFTYAGGALYLRYGSDATAAQNRTSLGLGTAATSNTGDFVAATNGLHTPTLSATGISTSTMSTTAYTTILAANQLVDKGVYMVRLSYDSPGNDFVSQIFWITVSVTASGSTGYTDLVDMHHSYANSIGRYFKMQLLPADGTPGLRVKLNVSDMASSGSMSYYITRMQ